MLTVTLVSLVVAAASGFIAWRSVRREHLRSDARVALAGVGDRFESRSPTAPRSTMRSTGSARKRSRLFLTPRSSRSMNTRATRRRPLLTAVAGLAVVLAVVVLIAMTGDRYDAPTPAVPARMESLELLSLRRRT